LKSFKAYLKPFLNQLLGLDDVAYEEEMRKLEEDYAKAIRSEFMEKWIPEHNVPKDAIEKVKKLSDKQWCPESLSVASHWENHDRMYSLFSTAFRIDLKPSKKTDPNDMLDIKNLRYSFFNTPLDDNAAKYIHFCLGNLAIQWNKTSWYYPGTALVQSSGSGKSRSVVALETLGTHVVYCSFMRGNGFPGRSYIADKIQSGDDVTFARYYYACLEVIAELGISNNVSVTKLISSLK
jgi:hypothetical protein